MNVSFLKSFFVFLSRNKLFTAINILGFAISLSFVILTALYIQGELRVDKQHVDANRIYRLTSEKYASFACPTAGDIQSRFPYIDATMRMVETTSAVSYLDGAKYQERMLLADSNFFSFFSFPLIEGQPDNVLRTINDVVISESFAKKLYGNESPVGREITIADRTYSVSGMMRDIKDSHLSNYSVVMPFTNVTRYWGEDTYKGYGNNSFSLYVRTPQGVDMESKLPEIKAMMMDVLWLYSQGFVKELHAEPLIDVYYSDLQISMGLNSNSRSTITMLTVVVLLILIFAVINYVNLSVAQAGFRAREAATRRLFGSSRMGLIFNFIAESCMICFVSLLVGLLLASFVAPIFNSMLEAEVNVYSIFQPLNVVVVLGMVLLLGAIAGVIPAYVTTAYSPIDVVRGTFRRKTKMLYSKVLITFQYCVTIVLVGCTIVLLLQTNYMRSASLGFTSSNILTISNPAGNRIWDLRGRFAEIPGVDLVSFAKCVPMLNMQNMSLTSNGVQHSFTDFQGDSCFFDMMGFEIVHRTGASNPRGTWINETAWKQLELADDATEFKQDNGDPVALLGRVRDFNFQPLSVTIGEALIRDNLTSERGDFPWVVLMRISGNDQFAVAKRVEQLCKELSNGVEIEAHFLNDVIDDQYKDDKNQAQLISTLALLAIVISSLGLLAMSTYFMAQRAQEIAIRKVHGATASEVLHSLVWGFLKLVIVAFVIAVPVTWYFMSDWLQGFAFRIQLSWWIFLVSGGVVLLLAGLTVLFQGVRSANANPIYKIKG